MANKKCYEHILITRTNLSDHEYKRIDCLLPDGHSHSHLGIDGYDIYRWS